jgi:hypothetical protein
MYQTLGCQCDVEPFLGDILNENPECKYHNWLEDMFQDGEDTDRYVTIKEKSNT